DADDGDRPRHLRLVQMPPHDARVPVEESPPGAVTENGEGALPPRAPLLVVASPEEAANGRRGSEHVEEIVRDDGLAEIEMAIAVGERRCDRAPVGERGGALQRPRVIAKALKRRERNRKLGGRAAAGAGQL